mgnify:CR=1 FL=1
MGEKLIWRVCIVAVCHRAGYTAARVDPLSSPAWMEESHRRGHELSAPMKRSLYTLGLIVSAVGFALSLGLLVMAWSGVDPTPSAPWIWRLHIGALAAWGLLFLLPGLFSLKGAPSPEPSDGVHPPPSPAPSPTPRKAARLVVAALVVAALLNFVLVMRARTGVTATSDEQLATQYAVSRLYALRMYAGVWLALYGVPLVGFTLLRREEPGPRPSLP